MWRAAQGARLASTRSSSAGPLHVSFGPVIGPLGAGRSRHSIPARTADRALRQWFRRFLAGKDGNLAPQGPVYVKWSELEGAEYLDEALTPTLWELDPSTPRKGSSGEVLDGIRDVSGLFVLGLPLVLL